jgi:toxin CcdB
VQSELASELGTRVVIPLSPHSARKGAPISTLMPVFEIEGRKYVMLTPQLAGVPRQRLGARVADLGPHRDAIIAALDLLFTGI